MAATESLLQYVVLLLILGKQFNGQLPETSDHESLDVPTSQLPYFLKNELVHGICKTQQSCEVNEKKPCWGYEEMCETEEQFSHPTCSVHHRRWARTLQDQKKLFWEQGDFGYIRKMKKQVHKLCIPKEPGDSSLTCTKNLWFCQASNIYLDLKRLNPQGKNRFNEDVLREGEVGGHCQFDQDLHKRQGEHSSPLQSWYAELQHYTSLSSQPLEDGSCDVVIGRPTMLLKFDSGVNLYHHFCNFVNLYVSQHMNGTFSTDINIVMWDTSSLPFTDLFSDTWKAFTRHPIIRLDSFNHKRVCFRDAVFSFLPRMIRGLYFNMPLVPGCQGSGLFKAFSHHVLHRLRVKQDQHSENEFRITLLARSTKYRKILNQDELMGAMINVPMFRVQIVDYTPKMPFLEQLKVTHNSDIFIGMHGAGLAHLLFLPDWAVVFELYNTEDPDCYRDLARLRGVTYLTWENPKKLYQPEKGRHPTLGEEHAKFANYAFDVDEFMRLIYKAADAVKANRAKERKR